jgi:alpha-tubulin suppressor-like RCC1 family protein
LRTNVPPGLTNVMAIACSEQEGLALLAHGKPFLTCPLPDRVGLAGGKVYFRMQASGEWPLSYQWRYCGTNLPGQTNMVLKLSNLEPADAGPYSVVVSNALGEAVSREARLSLAPFFIQRDPQGTNIGFGGSANLAVQVQSQFPLSYQWRFNGADIPGATNGTLSLENATFEMTGNYSVVINNSFGVATSAVARVTVRQLVEWPATYEFQKFLDDTTNVISLDFVDASSGAGVVAVTEGSKLAMSFVSYEDQTKFAAPPNLTNVLSAVIGSYFDIARGLATALRGDGGLVEWGEAGYLPFGFPANLSNVVAVFAGSNDRNALQADGNIVTWQSGLGNWATNRQNLVGINDPLGIRGDGNVVTLWTWYSQTNIPASLTNVVAISGDDNSHYLGLRSDRTVTAWLPPDRMDDPYGYTLVPPGLSNVCAVVAGWYESFALRRDGTLAYWGGDEYMRTNIPPDAKGLVQLAAGYPSRIGVIGYGPPKVLAHAGHFSGVVGGQTLFQCKAAGKPPLYYQWRKDGVNLPGATNAMLVLRNTTTADNGVYSVEVRNALGTNVAGAAHLTIQAATFPQPAIPQQAFRGGSLTLAPQVYGSGAHSYQWLLNGVVIAGATNATLLLTGFDSTQAGQYSLRVSNEFGIAESPATSVGLMNVAAWGKYAPDCSGAFGDKPIFTPLGLADAVQVAAGGNHAVALRRNGTVVAWGSECDGKTSVPSGLSSVVGVAAGANHSLALLRDGRVVGWGNNSYGQTNPPPHLTNAIAIATAGHFSAALRNDGTVAVWGTDNPVPPAHLTNVAAIAVGNTWDGGWGIKHGLALRQNRTVAVWGYDFPGQTSVLATLTNVIAIAAGDEHSLALRSDGTVAAWGNNSYGQTNVPPGLSNVIAIAAGARHSLALRSDRTVVGWGENYGGQTNPPVGLSNAVAITAGGFMSLALVGTPETDRAHLALQLAAGKPEVHVSGPPGQVVAIQSSSNLVNWATVAYQTNYTGHWLWPDASAGDRESVFYRSVADGQTVTPFALSGATVSADGTIRFTVYGPPGWNFRLEASTNLLHWTPVAGLKSIGETPVSLKLPGGPAAQLMRVVAP